MFLLLDGLCKRRAPQSVSCRIMLVLLGFVPAKGYIICLRETTFAQPGSIDGTMSYVFHSSSMYSFIYTTSHLYKLTLFYFYTNIRVAKYICILTYWSRKLFFIVSLELHFSSTKYQNDETILLPRALNYVSEVSLFDDFNATNIHEI